MKLGYTYKEYQIKTKVVRVTEKRQNEKSLPKVTAWEKTHTVDQLIVLVAERRRQTSHGQAGY